MAWSWWKDLAQLGLVVAGTSATTLKDPQRRCLSFQPEEHWPTATRTKLHYVSAGTKLTFADNPASCNWSQQVVNVDLCRVAMSVPTSNRSSITLEVWLPEHWEGRFLATGNGGVDGCIKYEDLAYGASNGFASVGANNGHNGTTLFTALGNEDVIADFAHRSLHTAVEVGKRLARHFYGRPYNKSYYLGCSLGGRQGIDAADRYPDDFDGVVAGAPAVDWNRLYSSRASFFLTTGASTDTDFIQIAWWRTWIHAEVLQQCDSIDGVHDGIIEDPMLCNFDPSKLSCSPSRPVDCLTTTQVEIVRSIYSEYRYPDGRLIYPGMQPGNEVLAADGLYSGKPFASSVEWFKYVILSDSDWNPATYSFNDAVNADEKNPASIRTWPSDLPHFRQRGGKLLLHHGQQDNQISSFNTPRFYKRLQAGTGFSYEAMDAWVRFFRISGMNHCNSGPGGWVIGQGGNAAAAGIGFEAESNVLAAIVDWVERDVAPASILGTKFVNDTVSSGVQLRRKHCKWPGRNTYLGGDANLVSSWKCFI